MVERLLASLCPDYDENALVPFPGRQLRERILIFEDLHEKGFSYNININGGSLLIFLNNRKRMCSLEVGIRRERWICLPDGVLRPIGSLRGCLDFSDIEASRNELDLPLAVYTDPQQSAVKLELYTHMQSDSLWVTLSRYCLAEVMDNQLIGFWLDISDY